MEARHPDHERDPAGKGPCQGRRGQDPGDRHQGAAGRGMAEESRSLCLPDPRPSLMTAVQHL